MPYVRDSFWAGRDFACVADMQAAAALWCAQVAGRRSCRPLGGAAPGSVFAAVERPALLALPATPFELASWSRPKVGPDLHVKVGAALYSLPWRLIGVTVEARQTARTVEFFHDGQLVRTHVRKNAGRQTDWDDYPPEKIAFHMRTPTWCRTRAEQVGPACRELIDGLLEVNALFRLRAAQGVLGLADRHHPTRLDKACRRALDAGDPTYRTVKGILAAGTETTDAPAPTGDGGAPAHLHGPGALFTPTAPAPAPAPSSPAVSSSTAASGSVSEVAS